MKLRQKLEQLVSDTAPELGDIEIVTAGQRGLAGQGAFFAAVSALRPGELTLNPMGVWREAAHRLTPRARRRHCETVLYGVVLHELGHLVVMGKPRITTPAVREASLLMLSMAWRDVGFTLADDPPPWYLHEAGFIRAALHLAHRARVAGWDVTDTGVVDTAHYGLTPTRVYRGALGTEPETWVGQPLQAVLKLTPPPVFTALFAGDRARWYSQNPEGVNTMLAELTAKLKARKTAKTLDFLELVRKVASGDTPDVGDVEEVLSASNKTAEELAQAVEVFHKRQRWSDSIQHAAQAEERRPELLKAIADADAELQRARERHAELVAPLGQQLHEIEKLTHDAHTARRELQRTCQDGDLLKALADATAERNDAVAEVSRLEQESKRTEQAKSAVTGLEYQGLGKHEAMRAQAKQHTAAAEKAHKELPAAKVRLAEAENRERELRAQLLVP